MLLTSFSFIGFVLLATCIYYVFPKRYQWVVLLAASYSFYAIAGKTVIVFLIVTTISTYGSAILLEKYRQHKRPILFLNLALNFGMLILFKYTDFAFERFHILIPLGISFYIFQSAAYLLDIHRGRYAAEKNLAKFALFVSFFPQIIQGPISRYDQLAPQLFGSRRFDFDRLKYGIQLMLWGYMKKMIIADRAAIIVNQVFGHYGEYPGSVSAVGVLFYTLQIYADFSGGIDIIRGVAQILGIDMIENFRQPFFATSLADFWRRWHISLGSFMKDYLFYSISFSKSFLKFNKWVRKRLKGRMGKILPTSLVTFVVFFTIGMWHGAQLKFIAFGLWNGVIISGSLLLEPVFQSLATRFKINQKHVVYVIMQIIRTNLLVFIGRYFTRAGSLMGALYMLKHTFTSFGPIRELPGHVLSLGLGKFDLLLVVIATVILFSVDFAKERGVTIRKSLEQKNWVVQWICLMGLLVSLTLFGIYRDGYIASQFIYQQL